MKFLNNILETFLLRAINVDRYLPIQLDITNSCNLRCVHCYHPDHKNEGALSLNEWKEILNQYKALIRKMHYRPWVVLCGGEPMVSPHLFPLLEYIRENIPGAKICILTNGTLVTEELARKLKSLGDIEFQVSLDGPDSKRHDRIRGEGNFDKALDGINNLLALNMNVNVLSVLSYRTSGWMEDFFKLAKEFKFKSVNFVRFVPEGYGRRLLDASEDRPLEGAELKAAYRNIIHFITKYQVRSATQSPLFELLIPGLGRSGRYWELIVVDYQGYIIASSRSKIKLGHSLRDGLESVYLNNSIYKELRAGNVEVCGKCPHYEVCGGDRNAAYAATGNFLGPDPGCWKENFELNKTGVL